MQLPIRKEVNDGWVSIVDANGEAWFEGTGNGTEGTAADIIVTACNEHHQLLADKAQHRAELLAVVAKVAAAGIAMDQADKVQGMLIDALKAARNTITGMGYSTEDIDGTMVRINEALRAADGVPE